MKEGLEEALKILDKCKDVYYSKVIDHKLQVVEYCEQQIKKRLESVPAETVVITENGAVDKKLLPFLIEYILKINKENPELPLTYPGIKLAINIWLDSMKDNGSRLEL